MSLIAESPGTAVGSQRRAQPPQPRHRWAGAPFAVLVVVARLIILRLPVTPDEGGYLLSAAQWHHGTSTYGDYFVDRPPLLMAIYALADLLGGAVALRLIGIVAAAVAVMIGGRIGGRTAAAVVAVFVLTPLFGTTNVDGELVALPLILGGLLALLSALAAHEAGRHRAAACAGALAGASATAAVLIKQDLIDVFVAVAAVAAVLTVTGRRRVAVRLLGWALVGAVLTGVVVLVLAWTRGTSGGRLWDALVTFRVQAGRVISANGAGAGNTTERLHALLGALMLSGAPVVAVVATLTAGRPRLRPSPAHAWGIDLRWVALPVLGWELTGVLLGGSYWLHYLIALIPALVLLASAAKRPTGRRSLRGRGLLQGTILVAAVSSMIALVGVVADPPRLTSDAQVSAYLSAHRREGSTVVVAFGHPNIIYDAGMRSPYEHLWSLSPRVRDPRLQELSAVMSGPLSPQWIVVAGASLGTWGIDATAADQVLRQHYRPVDAAGDWHVFEHD